MDASGLELLRDFYGLTESPLCLVLMNVLCMVMAEMEMRGGVDIAYLPPVMCLWPRATMHGTFITKLTVVKLFSDKCENFNAVMIRGF